MTGSITSQPHVPPETKGRTKTIAVAAAAWHLRALVRAAVENKRTKVVEASCLEDLRVIASRERIGLVILDADLTCDGTAMSYECLKRDLTFTDVPFIVLTNRAAPDETPSSGLYHPDRALHKHFSPFELLNIVYTLTGY